MSPAVRERRHGPADRQTHQTPSYQSTALYEKRAARRGHQPPAQFAFPDDAVLVGRGEAPRADSELRLAKDVNF